MDLKKIVQKTIQSNSYLTLASTNGKNPWINTVFYAFDEQYNFYFKSYSDSLHVKNISNNPNIAVTIFDSHQPLGTGEGVQIKAKCNEVSLEELPKAIDLFFSRYFPDSKIRSTKDLTVERFTKSGESVEKMYKIIPEQFFYRHLKAKGEQRIEVLMN